MALRIKPRELVTGFFRDNLTAKLLSLVIAVGMWAWIQGEQVVEDAAWVRVEYKLDDGLVFTQNPAARVKAQVSGAQAFMKEVRKSRPGMTVDLKDLGEGVHEVEFTKSAVEGLPPNVKIEGLLPNSVSLQLEPKRVATVRLKPVTVDEPEDGYRVSRIVLKPTRVDVEGPASLVESLESAVTEPIAVGGLTETTTVDVELELPRGVSLAANQTVQAEISIEAVLSSRTFVEVPVVVRRPGWTAQPASATVSLRGPRKELEGLSPDALTVLVVVPEDAPARTHTAVRSAASEFRYEVSHPGGDSVVVTNVEPSRIVVGPTE